MSKIKKYIKEYDLLKKKPDIYLIANAQDYTSKISPYNINHANNSEFFSAEELGEIAASLFDIGCYTSIFYTESEFIDYIQRNVYRLDIDNLLVINLARDGIKEGKKGLIPAFCDLFNLMYSGSNSFVVSLCRNKFIWSSVLRNYNINVPDFCKIKNSRKIGELDIDSKEKIIIKDICESASIDLDFKSVTDNPKEDTLLRRIKEDKLVQEYISGIEVEVPFYKFNTDIVVGEPINILFNSDVNILTSTISNSYDYEFSTIDDEKLKDLLILTTQKVVELLEITGYGRVDYRIDDNNICYVFDIATMPYIIHHSSFAHWFETVNLKYTDIYKALIMSTLYKYSNNIKKI